MWMAMVLSLGAATLLDPTPSDALRPLATDRPTLTFSPLSVDAGHLQLETDIAVGGFDGRTLGVTIFGSTLRAGLTDQTDLQVSFPTLGLQKDTRSDADATTAVGSFTLRLKANIFGNDGSAFALGVIPTATFGNGPSSVGVIVPLFVALPSDFGIGGMVQGEAIANGAVVDGRVLTSVVLTHLVTDGVTGYFEAQGELVTDVAAASSTARLLGSSGVSWLVTPFMQLDAGFRVPLTGVGPVLELFVGTSFRT